MIEAVKTQLIGFRWKVEVRFPLLADASLGRRLNSGPKN